MKKSIAVCPGSFDPVTKGHLDIIARSSKMFEKVIVVVMSNAKKINSTSFTIQERMDMIRRATSELPNVEVDHYEGLLAEYAAKKNAAAIVKGLRAVTDFEYELQMSQLNNALDEDIDTVFLTTSLQYAYLNSTIVKEVASYGGDISRFVPEPLVDRIYAKYRNKGDQP